MSVATSYHRTFLAILVVAITVAFVVVMRSFLITIMLAAIFTGMVYPGYRLLLGWCRGRQRLAAAISILVIVLLVVLPSLALIGVLISQGIQISNGARSFIQQEMFSGGWTDRLQHIPFMDRLLPYRE
ncbi:MAG TPA: hypothetical protein VFH88_15025, partial [Candidatus Krumholzibacteria bacterium]|nr:hypothetical protein [Candidatus Krumholzibacteria bacterium]